MTAASPCHELLADALALGLRLCDAGQSLQEAVLRIDPDEANVPLGEGGLYLVPLVQAQEAVVHKDAGELGAHGLGKQSGGHGAIHPAAEGQENPPVSDRLPEAADSGFLIVLHGPVAGGPADFVEEIPEHGRTLLGVVHLRVELDAIEAPGLVGDGHVGTGGAAGAEPEALGDLLHVVPVAHPGDAFCGKAPEELAVRVEGGFGFAVLPGGIALGGGYPAA